MEERVGPYHLLCLLGEGGMGIVYKARQEAPIRRTVALKVIKAGMDTKQVVARFEAERQALALMNHPGIAKVLDGGETETGRPYFVMELVDGMPVQDFADENALSLDQRLCLFMAICRAVEHAHQKGIIHRDLKPSNVLVTTLDGKPVPQIIDFGIAKAIAGRRELTDKTLFTSFNQVLGTPAYMSPEQLDVSGNDLDTRTDIYALGVILYEMLTGVLPFDQERLVRASSTELEAILCEEEPPLPSKHGRHELRGDLDWIVMKALAKDPNARYNSAGDFAGDIEHYLAKEPVRAAAPTKRYLLAKFAKRHRLSLAFVGSMLVLLIAGTVISTQQAIRATRAERVAEKEGRLALQRLEASDAMVDFITLDLLGQARPSEQADRDIKLSTVLEGAAERVNEKFAMQPRVRCFMNLRLASIFENLGRFVEADAHAVAAREALTQLNSQGPPEDEAESQERAILDADITYQMASHHMGRSDFKGALPILKEALEKNKVHRGLDAHLVAEIHEHLGLCYHGLGELEPAIVELERASRLF